VVPDVQGRLPGRGMWVTASREAVDEAAGKNLFSRSAKTSLSVPADLADRTESGLCQRALDLLGLARKAGLVICGLTKVDQAVNSPKSKSLGGFVHARDGGADGGERIKWLAKGRPVVGLFTIEQLSLALGGGNVVHAALVDGGLTKSFLKESDRLSGFLSEISNVSSNGTEQRVA